MNLLVLINHCIPSVGCPATGPARVRDSVAVSVPVVKKVPPLSPALVTKARALGMMSDHIVDAIIAGDLGSMVDTLERQGQRAPDDAPPFASNDCDPNFSLEEFISWLDSIPPEIVAAQPTDNQAEMDDAPALNNL